MSAADSGDRVQAVDASWFVTVEIVGQPARTVRAEMTVDEQGESWTGSFAEVADATSGGESNPIVGTVRVTRAGVTQISSILGGDDDDTLAPRSGKTPP